MIAMYFTAKAISGSHAEIRNLRIYCNAVGKNTANHFADRINEKEVL